MYKWIISFLSILLLLLSVGCKTTSQYKFRHPEDINEMCFQARDEAKSDIESKGYNLKIKRSATVLKHDGEKKFYGIWAWREPVLNNAWVCGLCWWENPIKIEVACNPQTMQEVSYKVTHHEYGHYWLISNYSDDSHNPEFKDVFYNWADLRIMTYTQDINGIKVIVDYIQPDDDDSPEMP